MSGLICWNCGQSTGLEGKIMRSDSCQNCLADLRCCRGCRFFDPTARSQCREPIDSPIPNKEKSNFCDYFQVRAAVQMGGKIIRHGDDKQERKKRFDSLFDD